MKILLCDTIVHPTPILKGWYLGLADLGLTPKYLPIPQYSLSQIQDEFDVIVYPVIEPKHLPEFEDYKKRFPKTKIIGCRDEWVPSNLKFKDLVDFFVIPLDSTPSVVKEYKKNGFKAYNMPLAGNKHLFFKSDIAEYYDACFIGTLGHGYRKEDKYLYPILDKYNNSFLGGMVYRKFQHGFIPYELANGYRNSSKINLNFHYDYQIKGKGSPSDIGNKKLDRNDINQSVFNIALTGRFQLCDHPSVIDAFKNNIVVANEDDWMETFEYYLHKPKERFELAHKAMLIAQKEHTWEVRMLQFLKILKKHYEK